MTVTNVEDHGERLSRVEVALESLVADVQRMAQSAISTNESILQRGRTDWGAVFGAMALVLVIIGFAGNGYVRDLDRIESAAARHDLSAVELATTKQLTVTNQQGLKDLDTNLQREMRDLITTIEQAVHNQSEKDSIQFTSIKSRLGTVEAWGNKPGTGVLALNAAQWERIKALERKVFKEPAENGAGNVF